MKVATTKWLGSLLIVALLSTNSAHAAPPHTIAFNDKKVPRRITM
jgi:hypothetical protein